MRQLITLITFVTIAATAPKVDAVSAEPVPVQGNAKVVTINIHPLVKKTKKNTAGPPAIRLKYFYLERPETSMKFSYELNNERLINLGEESEDTIEEFREGIGISTKGWLYHPALLSFVLDFDPEWIQTPGNGEYTESEDDSGYLNAYSLDADILPLKPYTMHLFGRKYQNSFRNTFSERAIIDTDTYGGRLALKYKMLPTAFSYSNTKTARRGALRSSQDQDLFDLAMNHDKPNSVTRLTASFRDAFQTNEEEKNGIQTSYNYLQNTYFFKRDLTKKLMSDLSYNWTDNTKEDDSISFTSSNLRWTERLHWTHRKNLWSDYRILYQNQQTEGSDINTKSIGASLEHLLYENLTTSIDGEGLRYEYAGGTDDVYTGKLDFKYNRDIPWGTLNLTTGLDSVVTNRNTDENLIWATNEQHTVITGGTTFLRQENVDQDSIRVTDKSSSIVYIREQDYTVEEVGTLIRIRPTLFGNITDGQGLLVSYRYGSVSGYDDIVFGRWAGMSVFLWSTLRLSYDYYRRTQDIISGVEPDTAIDETAHKVQARVLWKWTDTTLSYDDFDTLLGSARTTRQINEQLTFRPARGFVLNFSGNMGDTLFRYSDEKEKFYRVATKIIWNPAYWVRTGFEAYEYNISESVQDESNTGVLTFIDLFYGKWICNLSYRYLEDTYQTRGYYRERDGFMLKISRAF